jgi:hypothetical protein
MKWYWWLLIIVGVVGGVLVWLYMLGAKESEAEKMAKVRAAKVPKDIKEQIKTDEKSGVYELSSSGLKPIEDESNS